MNEKDKNPIDPKSVINDYFRYVTQYRAASAALDKTENTLWPTLQIRGLLIELALKTYLCTNGFVERGHDLEILARKAKNKGLILTKQDHDNIIASINEPYYKIWNEKYLCRYPMPDRPMIVTVQPGHGNLDEMIQRIIDQSREKYNV